MKHKHTEELEAVLAELDNLAAVWGDEGVFRRCRDRLRSLLEELQCKHRNSRVIRDGISGMTGTVVCSDCGMERDWSAY